MCLAWNRLKKGKQNVKYWRSLYPAIHCFSFCRTFHNNIWPQLLFVVEFCFSLYFYHKIFFIYFSSVIVCQCFLFVLATNLKTRVNWYSYYHIGTPRCYQKFIVIFAYFVKRWMFRNRTRVTRSYHSDVIQT